MDWSKGFTAEYKLFKVDPSTWDDLEEFIFGCKSF